MMNFSELSISILKSNLREDWNKPERISRLIKDMCWCLKVDFGMPRRHVNQLKDNEVIETWYSYSSLPENKIGGSEL